MATEQEILLQGAQELASVGSARLWLVRLDVDDLHGSLADLLSLDERERAAAYPSATRGRRFVRARGFLRILVGQAISLAPHEVQFAYGRDGKPSLAAHDGQTTAVQFNLSHARELALVAVSDGGRVGADLAWTDGKTRFDHVAARFFSAPEQAAVSAAQGAQQRAIFWRIWVRKEAYLKGRGEGISEHIYQTDLRELPTYDRSDEVVEAKAGERPLLDQANWDFHDVAGLPGGYMGSVALERRSA